jgi:hypothetical protein
VTKEGFFTGSRTIVTNEHAVNYVRIELIPRTSAGDFSAAAGGTISLSAGHSVVFESNSVVVAAGNAPYSGNVHVFSAYLDPTNESTGNRMPGDLRGISAAGKETGLQSFGMMAVELEGDGGEKLQIAPGKKATLTMNLLSAQQASAPATIPLWYFNDTTGKWIEQGTASRSGNSYVGQVGHFSFWNCDAPCGVVYFKLHVNDQHGDPVAFANLVFESGSAGIRTGQADEAGNAQGWIVQGQTLQLKVKDDCGNVVYTQSVGPLQSDVNLGTVTATLTKSAITVKGSVVDCSNIAVGDGFVNILLDGMNYRRPVTNGVFSTAINRCAVLSTDLEVTAGDHTHAQLGTAVKLPAAGGVLDAGTLTACGTAITQFVTYTINGSTYRIVAPLDPITSSYNVDDGVIGIQAAFRGNNDIPNCFWNIKGGLDKPGTYPVGQLEINLGNGVSYHSNNTNFITCTVNHFDDPVMYMDGTFTGTVVLLGTLQVYPVSGSFKVKMTF